MVLFYTLLISFNFFSADTKLTVIVAFESISADTCRKCRLLLFISGGRERVGAGHTQYFQRVARLFDFLAYIRHNGRTTVRRKILQGETELGSFVFRRVR